MVVDDHDLARAGLVSVLDGLESVRVVGEATSARAAIDAVRVLEPDLVLMDIGMPGQDGLEAALAITTECPSTRVVMVSFWDTPNYLLAAYQAGAVGYISKGASRAEMVAEIERALSDRPRASSDFVRRLLDREAHGASSAARRNVEALSPRLREILSLLAAGLTNRDIADRLGVKLGTVKKQVEIILDRLGVDNRTKAAMIWAVTGLDRPDAD